MRATDAPVILPRVRHRSVMLRAKQKKAEEEARAKAALAEAAAATPMDVATENGTGNGLAASGGAETKAGGEQVRLLGIGGQSVKPMAAKGKRRQPAELRIQKGEYHELLSFFVPRQLRGSRDDDLCMGRWVCARQCLEL